MNIYFSTKSTSNVILKSVNTEGKNTFVVPALISIGLVDDQGNGFYAELNDTYTKADCDTLCNKDILPVLKRDDNFKLSTIQLREKLIAWLKPRHEATLLCLDELDIKQLEKLFPLGIPHLMKVRRLGMSSRLKYGVMAKNFNIYDTHHLEKHNALDDARTLLIVLDSQW